MSTTTNNSYFRACSDGTIVSKEKLPLEIKQQTDSFIEVLNLNHKTLKEKRAKDVLNGLITASKGIPIRPFWQSQFDRILRDKQQPFRQFLLIFIGGKLGIN